MKENEIGNHVVDCSIKLHTTMGPGLLETVYELALAKALEKRGLEVSRQVPVPIEYDGIKFDEGFRADLVVEDKVIVELTNTIRSIATFRALDGFACKAKWRRHG